MKTGLTLAERNAETFALAALQPNGLWTIYESDGEIPDSLRPVPEADPVPDVITMAQARKALALAGKLAEANAAIDSLPEPQRTLARIDWEYSAEVHRNHLLVLSLGPALGLTSDAVDELFRRGAAL